MSVENVKIYFNSRSKEYPWLSNFYEAPFKADGLTWPTSEHYFQAQKFTKSASYRREISRADSPLKAKNMGRTREYPLRSDWESVKEDVMRTALYHKFTQTPWLGQKLVATNDAYLIERSDSDSFWGDGKNGDGKNRLGHILGETRERLRIELGEPPLGDEVVPHPSGSDSGTITPPIEKNNNRKNVWTKQMIGEGSEGVPSGLAPRKKNRNQRNVWKDQNGDSLFQVGEGRDRAELVGEHQVVVPFSALPPKARVLVKKNQHQRRWQPSEERLAQLESDMYEEFGNEETEAEFAPPPRPSNSISFAQAVTGPTTLSDIRTTLDHAKQIAALVVDGRYDSQLRRLQLEELKTSCLPYLQNSVGVVHTDEMMCELLETIDYLHMVCV